MISANQPRHPVVILTKGDEFQSMAEWHGAAFVGKCNLDRRAGIRLGSRAIPHATDVAMLNVMRPSGFLFYLDRIRGRKSSELSR